MSSNNKEKTCSIGQCEEIITKIYQSSKRINEILSGITVRPEISCQDCLQTASYINDKTRAVLRNSSPLEIIICCNKVKANEIEEVLIHELIHAYDYSNNRVDFSSCKGLAFSEIRSAREAECNDKGYVFEFTKNYCIKDHAIRSTANLYPIHEATKCVNDVFIEAVKDTKP